MQTGRPTIPTEQKRLKGTLRADRQPTNALTLHNNPTPPTTPETLKTTGQQFWATAWTTTWISQTTDYNQVLLTAQTLDERDEIKQAITKDPTNRTLRVTLRELDKQLMSSFSLLGFTPSDRARLGVAEIKQETKLEALIRSRTEHMQRIKTQETLQPTPTQDT